MVLIYEKQKNIAAYILVFERYRYKAVVCSGCMKNKESNIVAQTLVLMNLTKTLMCSGSKQN